MENTSEQKIIFISHIHEEASIALVLKEWIESTFLGQRDVFVSSDNADIPVGNKWWDDVDKSLEHAVAFIVLCSPNSITRPWINFETGCGWIKKVPILPICHSGLSKGVLPLPLSRFQAVNLEDDTSITNIFSSLSKHLGYSRTPKIDEVRLRSELNEALGKIGSGIPQVEDVLIQPPNNQLHPEAIIILTSFSRTSSHSAFDVEELSSNLGISEQRIQYFLDTLMEEGLISRQLSISGTSSYFLSPKGRKYLFENGYI